MRVTVQQVARALMFVTTQRWSRAVTPEDLVQNVPGMGILRAQHFLDSLRAAEAKTAQARQRSLVLTGNIEAAATGLRQFVVKRTNPMFQAAVDACEKKLGKKARLGNPQP